MSQTEQLKVERHDQVAVIHAPNYISKQGGELIGSASEGLLSEGIKHVVLDLNACALVNSVGISYLIEVLESLREVGGHLAFCCVSPTIAKTLQIMGLLQNATLHDSQDEAMQRASQGGSYPEGTR